MNTEQLEALKVDLHKAYAGGGIASWNVSSQIADGLPIDVRVDLRGVRASRRDEVEEILLTHGLGVEWYGLQSGIGCEHTWDVRGWAVVDDEDGTKLMIEGSLGMDGCEVKVVRRKNG